MQALNRCIAADPERTFQIILDTTLRAPKNDPSLFALATMMANKDDEVRRIAMADRRDFAKIVRTGTHLFMFVSFMDALRGWGTGMMRTVSNWYLGKRITGLQYQVAKYRNRYGWTHLDIVRQAHPFRFAPALRAKYPLHDLLFGWITQGKSSPEQLPIIDAFERIQKGSDDMSQDRILALIKEHEMTWEMLPTTVLKDPDVWHALLPHTPPHAILRNLGRMTAIGTLGQFKESNQIVRSKILNEETLADPRVHPIHILTALLQYRRGAGERGSLKWTPAQDILDTLDEAFDLSFDHAPQSGKRFYVGVDVSGSMDWDNLLGIPKFTPRIAAACLALAIARREPQVYVAGFSHEMVRMDITSRMTAWAVADLTSRIRMGGTDCSLPMLDAARKKIPVDCFVVITDDETWAGEIHAMEALRRYRQQMGINAKLIVIGLTATSFTIADPQDPLCLDIAGFDSNIPSVMNLFVEDKL